MASQNTEPTPPSSTSSNNGASPDGQQFRVVRKRNRIPLSCAPCRHRKLKCNRAKPCDNCTKRSDTASCNYATSGGRKKSTVVPPSATPDDMQNRIDRLEGLVLSLMTSGSQQTTTATAQAAISASRSESISSGSELKATPADSDMPGDELDDVEEEEETEVEHIARGIGIMKMDGQKALFASDEHWYAILGEIGEVKKWFDSHKEDYRQHYNKVQALMPGDAHKTTYLLSGMATRSKAEVVAAFPSKADSDRLIARYFNAYDPSVHIIHGPSFQKQYDNYWLNPDDTPIIWLGLCFAMMTVALQSYHRAGDEPPEYRGRSLELSHHYRRLTAECILLVDLTQPIALTLETLILHVQAEYGRSRDAEPGVLLLTSICARLAMRMGYHRDPGPHPAITPFQGEMRRRVWTFVRLCDLLISFQFGLPAIVKTEHTDTLAPRNLYDDELYEDMKALPPSRPTFEATPMTYMIAKSSMTFLFGSIVERTQSITNPPSYEETLKLDAQLRELRTQHPSLLQMRPFQESARDPANLIMQRLGLEMVYLRSLFVLHRHFISQGRENPRYAYSRRTCIDASMELLAHQATLHQESQPGGRLRSVKWYISSLTTHDFLIAAMLVCIDLYHTARAETSGRKSTAASTPDMQDNYDESRREQMMRAVEHCITIWDSVRDQSMEAYKASNALRVTVEKLKAHRQRQNLPSPSQAAHGNSSRGPGLGMFPNGAADVSGIGRDHLPAEQSAAMTLGMLSSGGMSPPFGIMSPFNSSLVAAERPSYPTNMAALLNDPMTERTGLTPQYSGPEPTGFNGLPVSGAASPLSQLFGQAGNFMNLDANGTDLDWGAWDSYIQGNNAAGMDANQIWPMNFDVPMDGAAQSQSQQQP